MNPPEKPSTNPVTPNEASPMPIENAPVAPVIPEPVTPPLEQFIPAETAQVAPASPSVNPSIQSVMVPPGMGSTKKGSKLKKFVIGFIVLLLFLTLGGSAVGAYLIAYEKVNLDKYPDIQKRVSAFVISLPFMPKTPKYLLARSGYVQQDVTKESFDVSMAFDSKDIASALGLTGMDLSAKGNVDYSDTKNVKLTLDASVTKDFNMELLKGDKILYFKINKVPQILLTAMGLKSTDLEPLLHKWVAYDTSHLDTEARQSIEDKEVDPLSEQYLDDEFQKYLDDEVLSKMKVSDSNVDGIPTYKVNLNADANLIDHLGKKLEMASKENRGTSLNVLGTTSEKLSDTVKSLNWDFEIDKKEYYLRKVSITSDLELDDLSEGSMFLGNTSTLPKNSKAKLAFVAKFGNFGKDFTVTPPESSVTVEEYLNSISEIFKNTYQSMYTSMQQTSTGDAEKLSDMVLLRSALTAYQREKGKYPLTLSDSELNKYLTEMPKDDNGENYYYLVATNQMTYEICSNLEDPSRYGLTGCTNPLYNTSLKNQ